MPKFQVTFTTEAESAGEITANLTAFTQMDRLDIHKVDARLDHPAGRRYFAEEQTNNKKENA